jgi:hypothetical protein
VAHFGVSAGAEATRLIFADVDGDVGNAELQGLKIGVDRHELDPGNPGLDHPVDRVDAATANPDNANLRLVRLTTPRRLILRLLPPITRSFHNRLNLPSRSPRLLRENPLKPLRRGLRRTLSARI